MPILAPIWDIWREFFLGYLPRKHDFRREAPVLIWDNLGYPVEQMLRVL